MHIIFKLNSSTLFSDFEYQQQLTLNQSRVDDITMKEDVPTSSYNVQDDEFGMP